MAETVTRQVPLAVTVLPAQGARVWGASPVAGRIVQVTPHWPMGCNALVDIAFGHGSTWVMPTEVDTFLALNDATPVFTYDEPVIKGEELWMIVRNGDGRNPHSVSVTVTLIGTTNE